MPDLLKDRLDELRQCSFSQLAALPPVDTSALKSDGKRITLTVWKDAIGESRLRVVVQVYRPWRLGVGRMNAMGFEIERGHSPRDLLTEELFEFM